MSEVDTNVAMVGWPIPRPNGRWHQAFLVTATHVWVTPEISFADNQALTAAAMGGIDELHEFIRGSGWIKRPERVAMDDVRGINWNETTGWLRVGGADEKIIGGMIPDRALGEELAAQLKLAIGAHKRK